MSFVLLGDSLNASLDATTVVADNDGRASVMLRAPDAPSTFRLRASIDKGPAMEIAVAVSDKGFGSIRVLPVYAGKRAVTEWTASVVARTTCAAIAQTLPADAPGAIVATAAANQHPVLDGAPVGPNLAVALRAGHYMWGCADFSDLVAGGAVDVKITVIDKPIDTSTTDLDLNLVYEPAPGPYGELLANAEHALAEAAFPSADPYGKTLLDAMDALVPASSKAEFDTQRTAQGWDALVEAQLAQGMGSLRDLAMAYAAAGLAAEPHQIVGHLSSIGDAPGHALLQVTAIGSIDAAAAGMPASHVMTWSADPKDQLLLGGALFWLPTRYAGSAALKGAQAAQPGAASVPEALAKAAGCDAIAAGLGPLADCDVTCLAASCSAAMAARWELGLGASAVEGTVGQIQVNASGAAKVSDTAAPLGLSGSWLGVVTDGTSSADVQGAATATTPQPN